MGGFKSSISERRNPPQACENTLTTRAIHTLATEQSASNATMPAIDPGDKQKPTIPSAR